MSQGRAPQRWRAPRAHESRVLRATAALLPQADGATHVWQQWMQVQARRTSLFNDLESELYTCEDALHQPRRTYLAGWFFKAALLGRSSAGVLDAPATLRNPSANHLRGQ